MRESKEEIILNQIDCFSQNQNCESLMPAMPSHWTPCHLPLIMNQNKICTHISVRAMWIFNQRIHLENQASIGMNICGVWWEFQRSLCKHRGRSERSTHRFIYSAFPNDARLKCVEKKQRVLKNDILDTNYTRAPYTLSIILILIKMVVTFCQKIESDLCK